ncbi:PDZK1-interacting protein 1 [Osmerus eperlanus]|uniref:PDZK1-interacting protein 1 n=1 Tax=Osmerus eperlanus TaxID=29151 RepID=UPI002E0E42F2
MGRMNSVLFLMLTLGVVTAQTAEGRALPQWLTGFIAVAGFLFLVFVTFLVNKAWCDRSKEMRAEPVMVEDHATTNGATYDTSLNVLRSAEHEGAYENLALDHREDKVTVM